jgi:hypothetical protein
MLTVISTYASLLLQRGECVGVEMRRRAADLLRKYFFTSYGIYIHIYSFYIHKTLTDLPGIPGNIAGSILADDR